VALGKARMLAGAATAYPATQPLGLARAHAAAALLRQDPQVEYAEPDRFVHAHASNDPLWASQWHYHDAPAVPGAIGLTGAWSWTLA
jgi:serine protease